MEIGVYIKGLGHCQLRGELMGILRGLLMCFCEVLVGFDGKMGLRR